MEYRLFQEELEEKIRQLLKQLDLEPRGKVRFPHGFSAGQRSYYTLQGLSAHEA